MLTLSELLHSTTWGRELTGEEFARIEAGTFVRRIPAGGFVCY